VTRVSWDKNLVLDKCRSSIEFQLWPADVDSRLEPWLSNFRDDELEHALQLLNGLMFFSEKMTKSIFLAAVNNLSSLVRRPNRNVVQERAAWQHFFDNLIVTTVTGESPSPADSGNIFARFARDYLGFDEAQILSNEDTLRAMLNGGPKTVIFVDDFVGSGQQFVRTWKRLHSIGTVTSMSFERYSGNDPNSQYFYCPALCAELGKRVIERECPKVILSPGNVVGRHYSAIDNQSVVWPDHLRASAFKFLEEASKRAGIPDTDGDEDDWRGFNKLALCLAFSHGVPDATLPIFTWDKNGWHYLLKRG
jgi:hypothetical protein